jgi:hypothetical protein
VIYGWTGARFQRSAEVRRRSYGRLWERRWELIRPVA